MNTLVITLGCIISFLVLTVAGSGKLAIKLNEYNNPKGTDYNGTCCDSDVGQCMLDKCDLEFNICIGKRLKDCSGKLHKVTANAGNNHIIFGENGIKIADVESDIFKGTIYVQIRVTDIDSDSEPTLVDVFELVNTGPVYYNASVSVYQDYRLTGLRSKDHTKLNISVTRYCDKNFFGDDCSIKCVAESFGCGGHYTCGEKGQKLCEQGWTGDNCDQQIPGGVADCSFYKDSEKLLPSYWEGDYKCPSKSSTHIWMNVTTKDESIDTTASLSINSTIFSATGSYFENRLIIQGTSADGATKVRIGGDQRNSLSGSIINGTLRINNERCSLKLILQKSYYNKCGQGTCVRYGQKQEETYCCCPQVSSTPCGATSKTSTSTTLKITRTTTMLSTSPSTIPTTETSTISIPAPTTSMTSVAEITTEELTTKPTTIKTTTETTTKPTTNTPSTTKPTTESITSVPSTARPTTSTMTTVVTTAEPTSIAKETTAKSTTETTNSITTQSTTKTTPMASKATTTKPAKPDSNFSFFIDTADDELDDQFCDDLLMSAWLEANKNHKLSRDNFDFSISEKVQYIYEKREHRGDLLTFIDYTLKITNFTGTLREPTQAQLQQAVNQMYKDTFIVYTELQDNVFRVSDSFSLYVYGPGPSDSQMMTWEAIIVDVLKNCSNGVCFYYGAAIKRTEEYIDANGKEVTRLYVYTLFMANPNSSKPNISLAVYEEAFRNQSITYPDTDLFYTGNVEDVIPYRLHYDLFVDGKVTQTDLSKFKSVIKQAWISAYPGGNYRNAIVTITGTEKYVSENKAPHNTRIITSIVYFISKAGSKYQSPKFHANLKYTQYNATLNITDLNDNSYQLYTRSKQHRYKYRFDLLIEEQVDFRNMDMFKYALKSAWLTLNGSLSSIEPSYLLEEYVSKTGELVTSIVCFATMESKEVDLRLVSTPTMSWFKMWLSSNSQIHLERHSGQSYRIYTTVSVKDLYLTTDLFSMYIEGMVKKDDWKLISENIKMAWNETELRGRNIRIMILSDSIYSKQKKREIVTSLQYTLHVDDRLLSPFIVKIKERQQMMKTFESYLLSLTTSYTLHHFTDVLLPYEYSFELFFSTKMSYLDFDTRIKAGILSALRKNWAGHNNITALDMYIFSQEKVYLFSNDSRTYIWKLVFYLTYQDKLINSHFVSRISSTSLKNLFNITGSSGHLYQLYTKDKQASWFYYNDHFSLTFTQEVSAVDWQKVQASLISMWCIKLGCSGGKQLTIKITAQEQYLDLKGKSYWRLVYFVQYGGQIISSQYYHSINVTKLDFSWTSVYGHRYSLMTDKSLSLWRYSNAFYMWTDKYLTYSSKSISTISEMLLQAWYKMNVVSSSCKCISIYVLPQKQYYAGNGKSVWKLTYFIKYKNSINIDSHTWPVFNMSLIDWSLFTLSNVKVITDIDLHYYQYMMKFHSSHKLSVSEYHKIEKSMTETWQKNNPGCGCRISIANQEEVIDSHGKSSWVIHYHIKKNDKYLKPSEYKPFNWTWFNSHYSYNSVYGEKLSFSGTWTSGTYHSYSQSGNLYLQTWIPPSLYGNFQSWLQWYYSMHYGKGSKIKVELLNTSREYTKKDGSSAWHLPFILKVNGSVTVPPSINSTIFETNFTTTTEWGKKYSLVHKTGINDKKTIFSVHLNHKVSENAKQKIKEAIIKTYIQQHPGVDKDSVNISFQSQHESFSTNKSEKTTSSWELTYTISVNGSRLDSRGTKTLNTTNLAANLNVTGPNNVKYSIVSVDKSSMVTSSHMYSMYSKSYVSPTDIRVIEEKIAEAWSKQYNSSTEKVKVTFLRQRQYLNSYGKVFWKWDYILSLNNTNLRQSEVLPVDYTHITTAVGGVISSSGHPYEIVQSTGTYFNYEMHFPLYLTTKMAKKDTRTFQLKLQAAWKTKGLGTVNVDIVKQEEIIHKSTGISTWKLVYFLKHNTSQTVIDSRVTQNINSTSLQSVTGPRGVYRTYTYLDKQKYLRYDMSKSVAINTKLDLAGKVKLQKALKKAIQVNITDSNLKDKIEVEVLRQEEYFSKNGKAWKTIYFIKVGGQYIPGSSFLEVDTSRLSTLLGNSTNAHGLRYTIVDKKDLTYSYRNSFSVYFTSKVSASHFSAIKDTLKSSWTSTSQVYKNCSCLSVDTLNSHHFEEVIDEKGISFWKLSYFLRNNGTTVESLTHAPINITHLSKQMSSVTNIKGRAYSIKALQEEKIIRTAMLFSFHMQTEIGFGQKQRFQESLKLTWIRLRPSIFKSSNLKVDIYRSSRYVDIDTKETVWKIDYVMKKTNVIVDPQELTSLSITELEKNITFTNPKGVAYKLISTTQDLVDYRMHFSVFVAKEIMTAHFDKFKTSLERYWNSTNKTVFISTQERFVNIYGKSCWKLVIFRRNTKGYIDSRTHKDINTTHLHSLLNVTDAQGRKYELINLNAMSVKSLKRYESGFSLMLSHTVRRADLFHVSSILKQHWKSRDVRLKNVTVEISSQEMYLSSSVGLVNKLLYFLSVDGSQIDSTMLVKANTTKIQQLLDTVAGTQIRYSIVSSSGLISYREQFSFLLTEPLLQVDYQKLEKQLSMAWIKEDLMNATTEILYQDDLIETSSGKNLHRVLYSVKYENKIQSATQSNPLRNMIEHLSVRKTGSQSNYSSLWTRETNTVRYGELFQFDLSNRVDKKDYRKLETQLKTVWKKIIDKKQEVSRLIILKQEKIYLENGRNAFRLSYKVDCSNPDYIVNSKLNPNPSHAEVNKTIEVVDSSGERLQVLSTSKGYRTSQILRVLLNYQVFKIDQRKLENAVLSSLVSKWKVSTNASAYKFLVKTKERVINKITGDTLWQYVYVVTINGSVIDVSRQPVVDHAHITDTLNLTSPRKQRYTALNLDVVQYNEMFRFQVKGIQNLVINEYVKKELERHWSSNRAGNASVKTLSREEFITQAGEAVTRYSYFLEMSGEAVYPAVMSSPLNSSWFKSLGLNLHKDDSVFRYTDCYKLYVTRPHWSVNRSKIHAALTQAWQQDNSGKMNVTIKMLSQDSYVGNYGVRINAFLYTVSDSTVVDAAQVTPDYQLEPVNQIIQTALKQQNSQLSVYQSTTHRIQSLFYTSFKLMQNALWTRDDIRSIETVLTQSWKNFTTGEESSGLKIAVVSTQDYRTISTGLQTKRIFYKLEIKDKTVERWQRDMKMDKFHATMTSEIQKMTVLKNKVTVNSDSESKVHTIYINGQLKVADKTDLISALTTVWTKLKEVTSASNVTVNVVGMEKYVNTEWSKVTKVTYTVTVNGSDPETTGITPPTFESIQNELKKVNKPQCPCIAKKYRKEYVMGTKSSIKFGQVQTALKKAWTSKNTAVKASFSVDVNSKFSRGKRAVTNAPIKTKLVGNNNKDVSPLEYTVSLQGSEPDSAFVDVPTDNDLSQPLSQAGAAPCGCTPKLSGTFTLKGATDNKDKSNIAGAITDAFAKENPGVDKSKIKTDVKLDNTKEAGEDVTKVDYLIERTDDEPIEDLKAPKGVDLERSLNSAGKTLYSKAVAEPVKSEDDYRIPVAVACAVVAFLIIVLVICYAVYIRRRSKKRNLIKRESEVKNKNSFDKEHFSEAAASQAYQNPTYDPLTEKTRPQPV